MADDDDDDDGDIAPGARTSASTAPRPRAVPKPAGPVTKKDILLMKLGMRPNKRGQLPTRPSKPLPTPPAATPSEPR